MVGPDEYHNYNLALGEMLTLVAYGQLIIENRKHFPIEDGLLDEIFDFMVRDFSKYAVSLHVKPSNTEKQKELSLKIVKSPIPNPERFEKIFNGYVYSQKDAYRMRD